MTLGVTIRHEDTGHPGKEVRVVYVDVEADGTIIRKVNGPVLSQGEDTRIHVWVGRKLMIEEVTP